MMKRPIAFFLALVLILGLLAGTALADEEDEAGTPSGEETSDVTPAEDGEEDPDAEPSEEGETPGEDPDAEPADGEDVPDEDPDAEPADGEETPEEDPDAEPVDGEEAPAEDPDAEPADEEETPEEGADAEPADGEEAPEEGADAEPADGEEATDEEGPDAQPADDEMPDLELEDGEDPSERLGWGIDYIRATFLDETKDVLREVMEIDGGMAEPVHFNYEYTDYVNLKFTVTQRNGTEEKELIATTEKSFDIMADQMTVEWPLYFNVFSGEDGRFLGSKVLGLRLQTCSYLRNRSIPGHRPCRGSSFLEQQIFKAEGLCSDRYRC